MSIGTRIHRRISGVACFGVAAILAASTSALTFASAPPAVTPMTPDIVDRYDVVLPEADYVKRVEMVPMRDGVRLYTVILMHKGVRNAPILLSRTPYDAKDSTQRTASMRLTEILPIMDADFVEDGYIRVYQDIRGLHHSQGDFVMTRPLAGPINSTGIDESTDAYDTIEWLVRNVPESNGRVGLVGSSYLGFTTLMGEIHPHPALKAAAPQSPMVDTWIGDDAFHNGAFRMNWIDYVVGQSTGKAESGARIPHGAGDDYSLYLESGSAGAFIRRFGLEAYPGIQKILQNPAYSTFWSEQAVDRWMASQPLTVPTFLMLGQWDQEDSYGAPAVYRVLRPKDTQGNLVHLAIGPWRHSGVNHYGYSLGALRFSGDTAREFRRQYLKPFFDHYLKDSPDPKIPRVITYATGIDRWEGSDEWPAGKPVKLYLHEGAEASFQSPSTEASDHDDYVSDPANPVPFVPRPISIADPTQWKTWLVADQRFVSGRPDVLSYRTQPLDKALHIMGAPEVELYAATSGTDSDFVVKLIDVFPNDSPEPGQSDAAVMAGYELALGIEIFRGRYLRHRDVATPLKPGKAELYRFNLPNVDHVFLPHHRLMVQIQSSLFPLYDRNPQTFVTSIFEAQPRDYRKATQSVFHSSRLPSGIELPVVAH